VGLRANLDTVAKRRDLLLPGIELGRPARSLFSILTELSRVEPDLWLWLQLLPL